MFELEAGASQVKTTYGVFELKCEHRHQKGDNVSVLVRPTVVPKGDTLKGRVSDVLFQQDKFKVLVDNGLYFYLPEAPEVGTTIHVKVRMECLGASSDLQVSKNEGGR